MAVKTSRLDANKATAWGDLVVKAQQHHEQMKVREPTGEDYRQLFSQLVETARLAVYETIGLPHACVFVQDGIVRDVYADRQIDVQVFDHDTHFEDSDEQYEKAQEEVARPPWRNVW